MKDKLTKLINVYKKYGFMGFCKKTCAYIRANYMDKINIKTLLNKNKYVTIIDKILKENKYDRVILWRSSFGYNVPLFQRPQHIANNLSQNKCLILYEVTTMTDNVETIKKINNNLYLINYNNILLNKILMKELNKINKPKYIQLYSTDWKFSVSSIKKYISKGFKFIYEYIDDLSPELAGTKKLPKNIVDKHEYAMNHKDVYIIVTASILEEKVIKKRGTENLAFSSNGVDYNFFQNMKDDYQYDDEFKKIMEKRKPIICYYGALAKWFDYDLIKKIAETNKYSIVLFGIKYDEAFDKNMNEESNVYFLGPKDYNILKYYANKCNIMIIPFKINNITEATSPLKIFEYMALHKPIVITDLRECRQYKSVFVSKTHKEFIKNLDLALEKQNDLKYMQLLDKEAKLNDWSNKARTIINLIKKDE